MDIKLDNLIEKIKQDGINEAKKLSDEIINKAKVKASSIVEEAGKKAKEIVDNANKEAQDYGINAENALKQAQRDLILVLKEKITALFDKTFKREVSQSLSPEFLKELILKVVEHFSSVKEIEVLSSSADSDRLRDLISSALKKELKNSVVIKTDDRVSKGFRIGVKGENVYYDFTDDAILEALKQFLTPDLEQTLSKDNG